MPMSTLAKKSLRSLEDIRPLYILPTDPLAEEVLIPGFQVSTKVDCMVGFFSSHVLSSLAPGLATYIANTNDSFRLIVSPFLSFEDKAAIENGLKSPDNIAEKLLNKLIVTEDELQQHTLKCLSWLLRHGRIEIRVALMKDALFHPKVWLFQDSQDIIAVHGSSNVTNAGIWKNIEQVTSSKSWLDPNQRYISEKFFDQFNQLWKNQNDDCYIIEMPEAVKLCILRTYNTYSPPTENELRSLYFHAQSFSEDLEPYSSTPTPKRSFVIPSWLQYQDGPFEHQGQAVTAWLEGECRGILEMATGSGKTITAMICAYKLYEIQKPLLIVIAAPYVPLIQQWCDEIEPFGLRPVNLTAVSGAKGRARELSRIKRQFRNGSCDVEVVVVTHRTLCDGAFQRKLEKLECTSLLIADEAHNLGAEGFVSNPPTLFDYRLGLSATPVRQYDEEGTIELFSYFGPVVFRFTLDEAIGRCLVEYDYFVHPVELTPDEMDQWYDLTAQIKANFWRQEQGKPDNFLAKLLRNRRVLLETAENKIYALEATLDRENLSTLRHTLIYASDKAPEQLDQVNVLLKDKGILFHQLTYTETTNRGKTVEIIKSFQDGIIRILTAKRVLDEGINIPQIQKAFILASTTVERQWIQRRGRLLRSCSEIGKTHSEIHDFIALPSDLEDVDMEARSLIRSELKRIQEFASLARNAGREDGPLNVIGQLVNAAYT